MVLDELAGYEWEVVLEVLGSILDYPLSRDVSGSSVRRISRNRIKIRRDGLDGRERIVDLLLHRDDGDVRDWTDEELELNAYMIEGLKVVMRNGLVIKC